VEKQQSYARARRTLLILFILSTVVAVILGLLGFFPTVEGFGTGGASTDASPLGVLTAIGSCITSVATLAGLISTTVLAWRQEQRETQKLELEARRQEIELEKARLELENLKAQAPREGSEDKAT
jgi:hypothetical protein